MRRTDGERVFVVTVADLFTLIPSIRTFVDQALCIVNIAILGSAAWRGGVAWVAEVEENQSTTAGGVARSRAHDIRETCLIVGQDVVGTSIWKAAVETCEVVLGVESNGTFAVVDIEKLVRKLESPTSPKIV